MLLIIPKKKEKAEIILSVSNEYEKYFSNINYKSRKKE